MSPAVLRFIATVYAAAVLLMGLVAAGDSDTLGYPAVFVLLTVFSHTALATGIGMLTYRRYPAWLLRRWKPVFACCVADLVAGLVMDATLPSDYSLATHGATWLANAGLIVLFLAPAFYLNYVLAFDGQG